MAISISEIRRIKTPEQLELLNRELWSEVSDWLRGKYANAEEFQFRDGQLLELRTAMRHEQNCNACEDIEKCKHSRAKYITEEHMDNNGNKTLRVTATPCQMTEMRSKEQGLVDLLEASRIPRPRRKNTFQNFVVRGASSSLMAAKGLAQECADTGRGLILGGSVGCGKTHLAIAIALAYIHRGQTALFYSIPQLMDAIRTDTLNGSTATIDKTKAVDLLVLDDAGTQRLKEFADESLFKIIDSRYNDELPVVITTNAVGKDEFAEMLKGERAERICSRLFGSTEQVWLTNEPDYRTKSKKER